MTDTAPIVRIAAKGDGVTADGRHVAGAVTGDVVAADGTLQQGPHHAVPPCRHFANCGGCQLQHCDDTVLKDFVTDRVVNAAASQNIEIGAVLPTHVSPPKSRRRATLHGLRTKGGIQLGYREERSHKIVDIAECPILRPELGALLYPLRNMLKHVASRSPADVSITLADQGVDCALKGVEMEGLEATEALLNFARDHRLARLSIDQGYGMEPVWEPEPVTVTLSGVPVAMPVLSFLQPTKDGEAVLLADAQAYLEGCMAIADLFAGLGTFAYALAGPARVVAVEAAQDAHLSCKAAANRAGSTVGVLHRDLFRAPLQADELARFDAVLLDPPRAGARDQIAQIASSSLERVCYISCNPASWARDAKTLVDAGFRLEKLRPVGQFRWSTHVELTSLFVR